MVGIPKAEGRRKASMESSGREIREDKDGKLAVRVSNKLVICLYSQEILASYGMMGVKARLQ